MSLVKVLLTASLLTLLFPRVKSIVLDLSNSSEIFVDVCFGLLSHLTRSITGSIRNAAAIAALGVQALYNGNQTGGVLGKFPYPPYYW